MAATVYIIRHAEAEGNIYRRCHGLYDAACSRRAHISSSPVWRSGSKTCRLRRFTPPPVPRTRDRTGGRSAASV